MLLDKSQYQIPGDKSNKMTASANHLLNLNQYTDLSSTMTRKISCWANQWLPQSVLLSIVCLLYCFFFTGSSVYLLWSR